MAGVATAPASSQSNQASAAAEILPMNRVTQPSRLRVRAASRRAKEHGAGRPVNSQAGTPALRLQPRFRGSTREMFFRGSLISTKNKHFTCGAVAECELFMTDMLNKTVVLVLNRNWQAINIRTPQEVFCMMATNVATVLEIEGE